MKDAEWLSYWLMILIFGTATGYDLQCPAKSEWRLRAKVSCYSENKYVCLFHLLENKYEENCLGSDLSSIGNKLVFQPLFNLAKCNTDRYQPIVFTTHGNSDCIFLKSKCDGEGQIVYSNGSAGNDTACQCDYTKGYQFVSTPKHSCFCLPSEEDCSCFRLKCTNLSLDNYRQCITEEKMQAKTKCNEVHPGISNEQHKQTLQYTESNISNKRYAHEVTYIIIVLITIYLVVAVSIVYVIPVILPQESTMTDNERQKYIQELLLKGECGKHHFARVVFIGQNGVGKTSLMRRLMWQKKRNVTSPESTDGIEIEKCNINVKTGKWSPCKNIDDDLTRLIKQVYKEKKRKSYKKSEKYIEKQNFVREHSSDSNLRFEMCDEDVDTQIKVNTYQIDVTSKMYTDSYDEVNTEKECYEKTDIIDDDIGDGIQTKSEHTNIKEIPESVEAIQSNSNSKKEETINLDYLNDPERRSIDKQSGSNNDKNVDPMKIMESCMQQNLDTEQDMFAFCWLWDFAGQKDFYATHQVFLSTCAVYLLVTDSLEFSTHEKLWIDFEKSAQYVKFWFDTIHCYWSTVTINRLDPPIIVVCTNEDKYQTEKIRQQRQEDFEKNLGKVLISQKKKQHLRNIYFVSNTEDDDSVFEKIRNDISLQAMEMEGWGKDCPLKWLLFQQVLGKLKDSNIPISTTTKLFKIARHDDIGITDLNEFTLCLQYYNDIGTIIYFDEDKLKDHVILDPKWLVDAFRCLVSDKISKIIKISDDWQKLRETGELTDSLISKLFAKEENLKFSENKHHLIDVMKRFDIIVNLKNSNALYMPCMMESRTFANVQQQFMDEDKTFNKTSWLCLEFEFLPPAFFNHILAWYIKNYQVSVIIEKGTQNIRKALYRQIGVFDLDSSGCEQLVVCEGLNIIALQVWNSRTYEKTYGDIGTNLLNFVDTLLDRYRLKITFTKTFKCKNGDFSIDRKNMANLLNIDYRCFEHKSDHFSDDLVGPWDFKDELRRERDDNWSIDLGLYYDVEDFPSVEGSPGSILVPIPSPIQPSSDSDWDEDI